MLIAKSYLAAAFLWTMVLALLVVVACVVPTDTTGTSGGGGGGSACNSGYCLNNGKCCPRGTSDYTYGGHGYAAGCYASCPYVGDCGASTQCF